MSQGIWVELNFLFHSFLMGIMITAVYDVFLILRRLIRHSLLLISLEDLLFWIGCAIGVFMMLYEENNGILRWFAVLGATLGMILYKVSISEYVISIMSTVIGWIFHMLFKCMRFIFRPLGFVGRWIEGIFKVFGRKLRKAGKYVKNRLTSVVKLLKITLCKQ